MRPWRACAHWSACDRRSAARARPCGVGRSDRAPARRVVDRGGDPRIGQRPGRGRVTAASSGSLEQRDRGRGVLARGRRCRLRVRRATVAGAPAGVGVGEGDGGVRGCHRGGAAPHACSARRSSLGRGIAGRAAPCAGARGTRGHPVRIRPAAAPPRPGCDRAATRLGRRPGGPSGGGACPGGRGSGGSRARSQRAQPARSARRVGDRHARRSGRGGGGCSGGCGVTGAWPGPRR